MIFCLEQSPVHSAHVGQELEVHYPWHPLFRHKVIVRRVEQRATGQFVLVEGPTGIVICIAGWTFDPITCTKMAAGVPRVDLAALLELKRALIEASRPRESPSNNGFVWGKDDEVSRLADDDSASANEPVVRLQRSRRTGSTRAKQSGRGTRTDPDAGGWPQDRGA